MAKRTSVIITVRNEAKHISALLESLVPQAGLHEVILVDANSSDDTVKLAKAAGANLPLTVIVQDCTRGEGRNIGAAAATGDVLAFIDGDCTAEPEWLRHLTRDVSAKTVCAGLTEAVGPYPAKRVPIVVEGCDVTWPSCNLAYDATLFRELGGFDSAMQTAEDVDLNLRAVQAGATMHHVVEAVVQARTRDSLRAHLRQAYAYGVGRQQLLQRHPGLPVASKREALQNHATPKGILRLAAGWLGYKFGDTS